jgi:cellulose synthase operon protein YhjQ
MIVITVASPKGGVGKTSLTANMAASLTLRGRRVFAIDLDPQNALRLHLGMPPNEIAGASRATMEGQPWVDCLFRSGNGVNYLPFGELNDLDTQSFEKFLDQQPDWLRSHLAELNLRADDIVLIDTPPGPSTYLRQALTVANRVLVVLLADAASYATIPQMTRLVETHCRHRADFQDNHLIVNQVDSSRQLARDVLNAMKLAYGNTILGTIHYDQAVSEALAYDQNIFEYAPHSLAAQDFNSCTDKLLSLIGTGSRGVFPGFRGKK